MLSKVKPANLHTSGARDNGSKQICNRDVTDQAEPTCDINGNWC